MRKNTEDLLSNNTLEIEEQEFKLFEALVIRAENMLRHFPDSWKIIARETLLEKYNGRTGWTIEIEQFYHQEHKQASKREIVKRMQVVLRLLLKKYKDDLSERMSGLEKNDTAALTEFIIDIQLVVQIISRLENKVHKRDLNTFLQLYNKAVKKGAIQKFGVTQSAGDYLQHSLKNDFLIKFITWYNYLVSYRRESE